MELGLVELTLRSCRTFSFTDGELKDIDDRLVVWWHGPVKKNPRASSVPKVMVFFRLIDDQNNLGKIVLREIALTHLGLLRIGSVWDKGICKGYVSHEKLIFDVSFSEGGWQVITLDELNESGFSHEEKQDAFNYFSEDRKHKTFLIDFFLPDGGHLLVPCVEFFSRCYGLSSEVKRVLATYPWEQVKERLFKPLDEPPEPDTWPVKLNWRVHKGDAIFLAHILYDTYAELAAKNVYAHIEKGFLAGHAYSFLRATPWFTGEGQLAVAGIPLGDGKSFLALRVLGSTQPGGATIQREKEQRGVTEEGSDVDDLMGVPFKTQPGAMDIIDLTDDAEPDHGSSWLDIPEEEFYVLGKPRKVVDRRRDLDGARGARNVPVPGDETSFSTGEAYGSGKGVGKANLYSSLEMESQGMLRDMWEAFRYLHGMYPNRISNVEWFTFENGFRADPEPKLIRLNPIEDDASVPVSIGQWPFIDHEKNQLRGALVIRVISAKIVIYIVEIQRRQKAKPNEINTFDEEHISGLCFSLEDEASFENWLRKLLSEIRYKKGIFKKILGKCPGLAKTFSHRKSKGDAVFCESAAKNAAGKMGLKL